MINTTARHLWLSTSTSWAVEETIFTVRLPLPAVCCAEVSACCCCTRLSWALHPPKLARRLRSARTMLQKQFELLNECISRACGRADGLFKSESDGLRESSQNSVEALADMAVRCKALQKVRNTFVRVMNASRASGVLHAPCCRERRL
jgi:hypothetical protein